MGIKSANSRLAAALFTPVQQRVLALLFAQPERRYQSAELIRLAASGTGGTHRLLTRLADAGLVTVTRAGNQKYYQANSESPVYAELHGLILKTAGLVEPLREALEPLAGRVQAAFVYGSVAKGTDTAGSDIDLIAVSDSLTYPDVYEQLQHAEAVLARPVNLTLMTLADWLSKASETDGFAARVAAGDRIFILGTTDELA